jgi:DNA-binding NarL/FixJ family response regulator
MTVYAVIQERRRLYRDGIALALDREPDLEVVGLAAGPEDLVELCKDQDPDVVVMEVDVSEWDPGRLGVSLQATCGPLRLVGLYRSLSGVQAREIRRARFCALVSTVTGLPALRDAVRGVRRLEAVSVDQAAASVRRESRLTARQLDVLRLVGQGSSTDEVGRRLGISPKTVAHHKQCVFRKLGVQNQAHAVAVAMQSGLLAFDLMRPWSVLVNPGGPGDDPTNQEATNWGDTACASL